MPSKKSPSRCPLVALEGEIRRDETLAGEVRDRLAWSAGRLREETPGASILVRETQAAVLRVVWGLQTGGHDLLTRCRALGELIRGIRALGLLRPGGMGGGRSGSALWRRPGRKVPPLREPANGQEQDEAGAVPERDEATDDSAA